MSKRTWNSGPPPHVGWWNASLFDDDEMWRWWNGASWSNGVHCSHTQHWAAKVAAGRKTRSQSIRWSDYWPRRARVPRIDPRAAQIGKTNQPEGGT